MKNLNKIICICLVFIIPIISYAQKDVTQFLNIPVDGNKNEIVKKLISKGFTIDEHVDDVLNGEFNGTKVMLRIITNNNKVWRIGVADINTVDANNIKIRFNNLIQQFANNNRYTTETDSTLMEYTIPKGENIYNEMILNNKKYQATFYQKSLKYDSLMNQLTNALVKDSLNNNKENLIEELYIEAINALKKQVWFTISEDQGKFRIFIFYDNKYNEANGEDL